MSDIIEPVYISQFFDTIQWKCLKSILQKTIREEDVLYLIEENTKSVMLEEDGELLSKFRGIYQGSGISPILSNIYLKDFDDWLSSQKNYYIRYSDDMVLLGAEKEELLEILKKIELRLQSLGLRINAEKTRYVPLKEGIDFLGYHFFEKGKTIPEKAKQSLQERLELMWLGSVECSFEEKLKKSLEIIGGWEQYFREERKIASIFEYVALIYAAQERLEYQEKLIEQRKEVINIYKDIAQYLAEIWKQYGNEKMELLEYEQFYQIWDKSSDSREQNAEERTDEPKTLCLRGSEKYFFWYG